MESILVKMSPEDLKGNALLVMNMFVKNARNQGFDMKEINAIVDEAVSKDYNHFLKTIAKHSSLQYIYNEDSDTIVSVKSL